VCTTDICQNNVCQHIQINNCCTSSSQCGTNQVCTNNICVATSNPPTSTTGKVYYVAPSPTGNDNTGDGSITKPWFSLTKAWNSVVAGDTIYMRNGTYKYTDTVNLEGKSGTYDKMINVFNYPGEHPIIDYKGVNFGSQTQCFGLFLRNDNYIHLKGIRVTNAAQVNELNAQPNYGMILWDNVDNSIFEQMETDHIGGWGVVVGSNCNNILFLNCDSHHNADPYSTNDPYGGSDGFQSGSWGVGRVSNNITYSGCRSWMNSDDGWDLRQAEGLYTIKNCWSFSNGYSGGNGEGYKLGQSFNDATTDIRRVLVNSLAWNNLCGVEAVGGESSSAGGGVLGMHIYNNVFYNNAVGSDIQKSSNGGYIGMITFRNNIVYHSNTATAYGFSDIPIHSNNNLDIPITVTDADFVSVNPTGADGPRNADGSLPNLDFLHLAKGSKLINAGVAIPGMTSDGYGDPIISAPDVGAFESNY
jgi:hypothetical protein